MTGKLRLGPLPEKTSVKLTIALPSRLKADLERYTELHAHTWGQAVDLAELIPHILETFVARDRVFKRAASSRKSDDEEVV